LGKRGFLVGSCGAEINRLTVGYSPRPKALTDFDAETARVEKALADIKRSYTLKLFARGEEAKELFASLGA
jgi:hypothetical protein